MIAVNKGNADKAIRKILDRRVVRFDKEEGVVRKVIDDVRAGGDNALISYAKKFDKVTLTLKNIRLSKGEIAAAADACDPKLKKAINAAAKNIRQYHNKQQKGDFSFSPSSGVRLSQRTLPIASLGLYIPGGMAPLFSTILMTAIPAQVAGVGRIAVATPCRGGLNPAMAYCFKILKIDEVYRVGGAQAVAAFAFGTKRIKAVDKVAGPGNIYVSLAKKILYGTIDIDMIAGPSEVLVIADESASAKVVARDLLSQSEHGTGKESSVLLTTSEKLASAVAEEIKLLLKTTSKDAGIVRSVNDYGLLLVLKNLEECAAIANKIAPEHLELAVKRPEKLLPLIRNAGAVFMGHSTCESVGDYYAGPSHVLPTNGTARFFSPLSTYHFLKRMSVVEYSNSALTKASADIIAMAEAEGLHYHAEAVRVRR
ncbi:MAG: histidinol dehydrogenase [Fibrobacteres bacterium]|nr:histidinol dehydrogenase [Fibrobacterota bacterium]